MGTQKNGEYGADQIQILEGLEAVRKRPGMYIGSTSEKGEFRLGSIRKKVYPALKLYLRSFMQEVSSAVEDTKYLEDFMV